MFTLEKQRGFVPAECTPNFHDGKPFFPVTAKKNIAKSVIIGSTYQMFVLPEDHDKFNPKKLKVDIYDHEFRFLMGINFYDFEEFDTYFKFSHD